jgi:hypothetical protein
MLRAVFNMSEGLTPASVAHGDPLATKRLRTHHHRRSARPPLAAPAVSNGFAEYIEVICAAGASSWKEQSAHQESERWLRSSLRALARFGPWPHAHPFERLPEHVPEPCLRSIRRFAGASPCTAASANEQLGRAFFPVFAGRVQAFGTARREANPTQQRALRASAHHHPA